MGTLTIRNVPDKDIKAIKEAAKQNNRSMESEVRSHIEEWTAALVAHDAMESSNLLDEMQRLLDDGGLPEGQELVPPREKDDARPVDFGVTNDIA